MLLRYTVASLVAIATLGVSLYASIGPRASGVDHPGFVPNVGQIQYTNGTRAQHVGAVLNIPGASLMYHAGGLHVSTLNVERAGREYDDTITTTQYRLDLRFVGANVQARFEPGPRLPSTSRFMLPGLGTEAVAAHITNFTYVDVWPNIDVVVRRTSKGPKVDFVVRPGGRVSDIVLQYDGATSVQSHSGGYRVSTPVGTLTEEAPVAWERVGAGDSRRRPVDVATVVDGLAVRFDVKGYDASRTLVIDPQVSWATYYSGNQPFSNAVTAVDREGNVILCGTVFANNLPTTVGVVQRNKRNDGGQSDGFVAKFNDAGAHLWSTYYGSTRGDDLLDVTVDNQNTIWACGSTRGNDAPVITIEGSDGDDTVRIVDIMILRLNADGSLNRAWANGGTNVDVATAIDVRGDKVTVAGYSSSPKFADFRGTPYTLQAPSLLRSDGFIVRYEPSRPGNPPVDISYFTYYGGFDIDQITGVATDAQNNIYVCGFTRSNALVGGVTGNNFVSQTDAFVASFAADGTERRWATFLGGDWIDRGIDIATDSEGNVIVVGETNSPLFPTSMGPGYAGFGCGFIVKHRGDNGNRIWGQVIPADSTITIGGLSVTPSNDIWVGGSSFFSTNLFITPDAFQTDPIGRGLGRDGFIRRYTPLGAIAFSSYHAADGTPVRDTTAPGDIYGWDFVSSVAADGDAYLAVASIAQTKKFPTKNAFQDTTNWRADGNEVNAVLSLISDCADSVIAITTDGPTSICDNDNLLLRGPTGFASYRWSTGASSRDITVSDTGRYILTAVTSRGCRYRDTIVVSRNPKPSVSAGADVIACADSLTQLSAAASGGTPPYRYRWNRIESGPRFIDNDTITTPIVNPTSTSRYMVTITDAGGCQAKDTVLVTIRAPRPVAVGGPVDFGALDACTGSADGQFSIRNPETYPVTIATVTSSDAAFTVTAALPITIAPGATVQVAIRYAPAAAGANTGTLTVRGTPCSWATTVNVRGSKSASVANAQPSVINFPTTASCDPASFTDSIRVRNTSPDEMTVAVPIVAAPFSVVSPSGSATIPSQGEVVYVIAYAPTGAGTFAESIRLPFTAGQCSDTLRVALNGRRENVSIAIDASAITVPDLSGCQDAVDTAVVITNNSSVPVTITVPSGTDVAVTPAGPTVVIPAGSSQRFALSVRPSAQGAFSIPVNFAGAPCDVSVQTTISGNKQGVGFTTPATIDMGTVVGCDGSETTVRPGTISFTGTGSDGSVATVITGPGITTTLRPNTPLPPGQSVSFDVSWTATADGALVDSVVVVLQPCDVRRVIRVIGNRVSPGISTGTPTIALGAIAGIVRRTAQFTNTGTQTIDAAVTATANVTIVGITPQPTGLAPGATAQVEFDVACNGRSTVADTITAIVQGTCVRVARIALDGTCTAAPTATASIAIDSIDMKVGERRRLPIRLVSSQDLDAAGAQQWTATVRYNPGVIVGSGATTDCWTASNQGPCTITVTGTRGTATVGTLAELDFTAVLGDAEATDVELMSFAFAPPAQVNITTANGRVRLSDVCREGGQVRLLQTATPLSIRLLPQPATDVLEVEIGGMGTEGASLRMHSMLGREVLTTTTFEGRTHLDVSTLPAGTYTLVIATRGVTRTSTILIAR